jgi:hypothetical protein
VRGTSRTIMSSTAPQPAHAASAKQWHCLDIIAVNPIHLPGSSSSSKAHKIKHGWKCSALQANPARHL